MPGRRSVTKLAVLQAVDRARGLNAKSLSRQVVLAGKSGISPEVAARNLAELKKDDFVTRKLLPSDGRCAEYAIAPRGELLLSAIDLLTRFHPKPRLELFPLPPPEGHAQKKPTRDLEVVAPILPNEMVAVIRQQIVAKTGATILPVRHRQSRDTLVELVENDEPIVVVIPREAWENPDPEIVPVEALRNLVPVVQVATSELCEVSGPGQGTKRIRLEGAIVESYAAKADGRVRKDDFLMPEPEESTKVYLEETLSGKPISLQIKPPLHVPAALSTELPRLREVRIDHAEVRDLILIPRWLQAQHPWFATRIQEMAFHHAQRTQNDSDYRRSMIVDSLYRLLSSALAQQSMTPRWQGFVSSCAAFLDL